MRHYIPIFQHAAIENNKFNNSFGRDRACGVPFSVMLLMNLIFKNRIKLLEVLSIKNIGGEGKYVFWL